MLVFLKVAFFWILIMALIFGALLLLQKMKPKDKPAEQDEKKEEIQDIADE